MEQTEIFKLYDKLSYGNKKAVCNKIAHLCNRQPNSVRNWFCSWKKVPSKFESITLKTLKDERAPTN